MPIKIMNGNWRENAHAIAAIATIGGSGAMVVLGLVGYFLTRSENSDLHRQVDGLQKQVDESEAERDKIRDFAFGEVRNGNITATDLCGVVRCGDDAPHPQVVITSPRRAEGNSGNAPAVPGHITVRGTSDLDLKDRKIWILTQVSGVSRLYPQGDAAAGWGPATLDATGRRWTSPAVYTGQNSDVGEHVDIIAVVADEKASEAFSKYLRYGQASHDFPGIHRLPAGALEYDRVEVVRGK